jgi:hypothetical protein
MTGPQAQGTDAPIPTRFPERLAWHARIATKASRFGAGAALAGGSVIGLVLHVVGAWLAGAVAASAAVLSVLSIALARRPLDPAVEALPADVAMEKVGLADQLAHGLARTALVLGCFFLGLWAADASGLGRA